MEQEALEEHRLLTDFKPLIHRTLQRLNITQRHMDYDDYYQELQLHLLNIRTSFSKNEEEDEEEIERYKFTAYAGKGLYWHGLNLIKRNQKKMFEPLEDTDLEWLNHNEAGTGEATQDVILQEFFIQAKKLLAADDYELLLYLANEELTMDDIAGKMQVTRSTIYQRRARIQERLQSIKNCLTD